MEVAGKERSEERDAGVERRERRPETCLFLPHLADQIDGLEVQAFESLSFVRFFELPPVLGEAEVERNKYHEDDDEEDEEDGPEGDVRLV